MPEDSDLDLPTLLKMVIALGRVFNLLEMKPHAQALRVYYLALQRGLTASPKRRVEARMSEKDIVDWTKTLRIHPYEFALELRGRDEGCAQCRKSRGAQTECVVAKREFPGGRSMGCETCGCEWLENEAPAWQKRLRGERVDVTRPVAKRGRRK